MARAGKPKRDELVKDYRMLETMSADLAKHQKNVMLVGKSVAKKVGSDIRYGFIDNLEEVAVHMKKAQAELEKAKRELKLI